MLPPEAKGANAIQLLESKNAANTATATGSWIAKNAMAGDFVVVQSVGSITGNLQGGLYTTANSNGAGNAVIVPNEGNFSLVSSANNIQKRTYDSNALKEYFAYIGTVGTGPVNVDVVALFKPKVTG